MIFLILGGIVVLLFLSGFRVVRPTQKAVVETFGKYSRFANLGLNWIFPGVQKLIKVNTTEQMMDIDPQDIITKDNLNARVDLVVYYQVKADEDNIKKSLYNVDNFEEQIVSLAQTTARNVIGGMVFRAVNNERNKLNVQLADVLDKESDEWGVKVVRVEMKEITPPKDVQETMNRVIKAENEKEAAVDFATAQETKADGAKRAAIKEAQGLAQGRIIVADAKATAIQKVNQAAAKYFKGNAQKLKQLEVAETTLKDNSKVILGDNAQGVLKLLNLDKVDSKPTKK